MLKRLHHQKIISHSRWSILYPADNKSSSNYFDITLLSVLMRHICNLCPPSSTKSWDKKPPDIDVTQEADVARVNYYRNKLVALVLEASVPDKKFEEYWDKISAVLGRMGGVQWQTEIDKMRRASLSESEKQCSTEKLLFWYGDDLKIKLAHGELESEQKEIKDEQQKLAQLLSNSPLDQQETSRPFSGIKDIVHLNSDTCVNQERIRDCQGLSLRENQVNQ